MALGNKITIIGFELFSKNYFVETSLFLLFVCDTKWMIVVEIEQSPHMFCSQQKSSVDILPFLTLSHRFDGLIVKSSFGSIYFAKSLPHQGDLPRSEHWPYYYKRLWTNSQTYVCCSCCVHIKLSGWFRFCSWSLFIYQLVFQNCRVAFIKRGRRMWTQYSSEGYSLWLWRAYFNRGVFFEVYTIISSSFQGSRPHFACSSPILSWLRVMFSKRVCWDFFYPCHKCRKREWFEVWVIWLTIRAF